MRTKSWIVFAGYLCSSLSPVAANANDIYGFVDGNGVPHYSNVPDSARYKLVLRDPDRYKVKVSTRSSPLDEDSSSLVVSPLPAATSSFDARQPFGEIIQREAHSNRLDPFLIAAVISIESNHNPAARSPKGAIGLMQLMPDTARRYGVTDPYHIESNIRAGVRYLGDLLKMFNGDVSLALAAYNAGENAVIRFGNRIPPYPETLDYVPKVLKKYQTLRKTG